MSFIADLTPSIYCKLLDILNLFADFSISLLILTTICAMDTSFALEPMVLVSRFISCTRKSSLQPTGLTSFSMPSSCCRWLRRRTVSSSTAVLSA